MSTATSAGWAATSDLASMPSRRAVPGARFCTTTSAWPSSLSSTARPAAVLKSSASDSLFLFSQAKWVAMPFAAVS